MRKKVSLIICILCTFLLAGCGKQAAVEKTDGVNENNTFSENITQNSDSFGYESYVGTYYREGDSSSTIDSKGGSYIEIQSVSGNKVKFTITAVSSAPSNRIASITAEEIIGENGIANFVYSDDGWGNAGSGAIVLMNDKVVVTSHMKIIDGQAMWKRPDYDNVSIVK